MHEICFCIGLALLANSAAYAQPAPAKVGSSANAAPEKPIDKGPSTPVANNAYQSGGMILEGAPGAPAPTPQAAPPGQTPANMVPPK